MSPSDTLLHPSIYDNKMKHALGSPGYYWICAKWMMCSVYTYASIKGILHAPWKIGWNYRWPLPSCSALGIGNQSVYLKCFPDLAAFLSFAEWLIPSGVPFLYDSSCMRLVQYSHNASEAKTGIFSNQYPGNIIICILYTKKIHNSLDFGREKAGEAYSPLAKVIPNIEGPKYSHRVVK